MKARGESFNFIENKMVLRVPYFQRAYVWKEDNWKELFDNLRDSNQSHFLGSIIFKLISAPACGEIPEYSIIDGQQRLTTLSILIKACYDVLKFDLVKEDDDQETKLMKSDNSSLYRNLLFYRKSSTSRDLFVKIVHSRLDAEAYTSVIKGNYKDKLEDIVLDSESKNKKELKQRKVTPGSEILKSDILKCYKYFCKRLSEEPEIADQIWNVLTDDNTKILVKIDLDIDENEQAIFDSVNSTGVRLTCAEIIKNILFQRLYELASNNQVKDDDVINFYKDNWEEVFAKDAKTITYWSKVQRIGRINRDYHELLLHYFAVIKGFFDPEKHTMSDLSVQYKNRVIKQNSYKELHDFIVEITEYGKTYRTFFPYDLSGTLYKFDNQIDRLLNILAECDVSTLNAYVLELLKKYYDNEEERKTKLFPELRNIEIMVIRYALCKVSTKNFNKQCSLYIKGKSLIKDEIKSNSALINDDKVKESLMCITNNQIATLVLFWVELYRRRNCNTNFYDVQDLEYKYSLEHVMPQVWETYWGVDQVPVITDDGRKVENQEEAKELRKNAIYEIGNMTIITKRLNSG